MKESLTLKETFPAKAAEVYKAWLDSKSHSLMTGGTANCSDKVGDEFTAWDGYISGKNIELIKDQKIVQTWRTSEFEENDEDSILTVELKKLTEGTELSLIHTNIPIGQSQYKEGWIEHYFIPMMKYFKNK